MAPKVFVIGGTGAQDGAYSIRASTRDRNSSRAQDLLKLGDVELVEGTFANEHDLRTGLRGCQYAFVKIDGFNAGEKTEIFWAIRAYELAIEEGIEFFAYGNLDYAYKKSGYDPKMRAGHYDGKGRVGEWILQQTRMGNGERMGAACFTTGPYIEMVMGKMTPMSPVIEYGVVMWKVPLGDGAVVHVSLEDCEYYVRWLFDNQKQANGMDLEVGIEHVNYNELAKAFTRVTGKPAMYVDTDLATYWKEGGLVHGSESPAGYNADPQDAATLTMKENFTAFWEIWRNSGGNRGVIQRDYAQLDKIHPNRIKSAEEWFRREDARGREVGLGGLYERVANLRPILKIAEDKRQGKI